MTGQRKVCKKRLTEEFKERREKGKKNGKYEELVQDVEKEGDCKEERLEEGKSV